MDNNTSMKFFENDIKKVMDNQYGYLSGEGITTFYDEFNAPILDIIEDGEKMKFVFRMTSNTYIFNKKGQKNEEHSDRRQIRVNRLNG